MIAFHGIGGVDQSPDFLGIVEKGSQALPVVFPGTYRHGVLVAPYLTQPEQIRLPLFSGGRAIDRFEIADEGFAVFPGHIFQATTNLMQDTALYSS